MLGRRSVGGREQVAMQIGPFNVQTVDECLDILEEVFQCGMWKELNNEDRLRIVGRLEHVLDIAQLKSMP